MARVLLVDDELTMVQMVAELLRQEGHEVFPFTNGAAAMAALTAHAPELVITDLYFDKTRAHGLEIVHKARQLTPPAVAIVITGFGSIETAVEAMKNGAFDYLEKPFKVDALKLCVQRALSYNAALTETAYLRKQLKKKYQFSQIIGSAPRMQQVFKMIQRVADTDSTIPNVLHSASRLVSLARDHWHMHERMLFDARHDALTGLPNRTLSEDRLEQALARARRRKQIFAVVCIDLDGFKSINDNLGHDAGDELLRTVAVRLRARIRHSDTLARVGGDEFLAIIEDCSGDSAAQSVAESLIAALQEPATLEGKTVSISGSIGIAMYPVDGKNAGELKRNADQAMYRAKNRNGGQICFWSGEPQETTKVVKVSSSSGS